MNRRGYKPEQIIIKLRKAEIQMGKGLKTSEACRNIGITENTYYRWRKKYRGMQPTQAKHLKVLEEENRRLKNLVADLSLDNAILKEFNAGKY